MLSEFTVVIEMDGESYLQAASSAISIGNLAEYAVYRGQ